MVILFWGDACGERNPARASTLWRGRQARASCQVLHVSAAWYLCPPWEILRGRGKIKGVGSQQSHHPVAWGERLLRVAPLLFHSTTNWVPGKYWYLWETLKVCVQSSIFVCFDGYSHIFSVKKVRKSINRYWHTPYNWFGGVFKWVSMVGDPWEELKNQVSPGTTLLCRRPWSNGWTSSWRMKTATVHGLSNRH